MGADGIVKGFEIGKYVVLCSCPCRIVLEVDQLTLKAAEEVLRNGVVTSAQRRPSTYTGPGSFDRNYLCTQDRDTVGRPATGDGLRQWYDLLAQTSGLAGSWCLGEPSPCHPAKFTRYEKDRLEQSLY